MLAVSLGGRIWPMFAQKNAAMKDRLSIAAESLDRGNDAATNYFTVMVMVFELRSNWLVA